MERMWGHHESSQLCRAALCTVLRCHDGKPLSLLSGHISHRFNIAQNAEALSDWGASPTLQGTKLLMGFDANETLLQPRGTLGFVTLSCTGRGEQILQWTLGADVYFRAQSMEAPSYFPYNLDMSPRRLDYLAAKGDSGL